MPYSIPANITPRAAAKLIILNELDLTKSLTVAEARSVLDALLDLTIPEILDLIDSSDPGFLSTDEIPQFGSIASLIRVPQIVLQDSPFDGLTYAQLGFLLKNDVNAKLEANIKFGENHGKAASLLGLISMEKKRFKSSSLSAAFCGLAETSEKIKLIQILFFRIPIVQLTLKQAEGGRVNGYNNMTELTVSTKKRRGQCLRNIFREFSELNVDLLSQRINNIYWTADEQGER